VRAGLGQSARPSGSGSSGRASRQRSGASYGSGNNRSGARGSGTYGSGTYGSGTYSSGTYGSGTYGSGTHSGRRSGDSFFDDDLDSDRDWDRGRDRGRGSGRSGPPKKTTKKSVRRRTKSPLWARLLLSFGAVMLLISLGTVGAYKWELRHLNNQLQQGDLIAGDDGQAASIDGAVNLLLMGIDQRSTAKPGDLIRADSIMVLHISADHQFAYLVSIPRDLYVDIPAYAPTGYAGGKDKINAAFAFGSMKGKGLSGGAQLLAKTVTQLTGLSFAGAAIVDFQGFKKVVDVLGGIYMCLDQPVDSAHIKDPKTGRPVHYDKGCFQLTGSQALDYVRQRYGLPNTDYDRQRHQQQFLNAILAKIRKSGVLKDPGKLNELIGAIGKAVTIDRGGIALETWIHSLMGLTGSDIVMIKTNGGTFDPVPCGTNSCEGLTKESVELFQALRDDRLTEFVINNPNFVSQLKS
jgi:LCP family protein required for cell wall assembly